MTDDTQRPTSTDTDTDDLDLSDIDVSDLPHVSNPSSKSTQSKVTANTNATRKKSGNPLRDTQRLVEEMEAEEAAAKAGMPEGTSDNTSAAPSQAKPPQKKKTTAKTPKPASTRRKSPAKKSDSKQVQSTGQQPGDSPDARFQSTEIEGDEDEGRTFQSTETGTKSLPFGHPDRDSNTGVLVRIALDDIVADGRFRARGDLGIEEIARSLELDGQLQPVHVREVVREDGTVGYELICGYRRYGGARKNGWTHINAIVVHATDEQAAAMSLVENHARKETSKTDVARALLLLRETTGKTLAEVAQAHGLGQTQAYAYAAMLKMPTPLQDAIADIEHGCELEHAKVLHKAAKDGEWDEEKLAEWVTRVDAERLSVSALRIALEGAVVDSLDAPKLKERSKAYTLRLLNTSKTFANQKELRATAGAMTETQRRSEAKRCAKAIEAIERYRAALVGEDDNADATTEVAK